MFVVLLLCFVISSTDDEEMDFQCMPLKCAVAANVEESGW